MCGRAGGTDESESVRYSDLHCFSRSAKEWRELEAETEVDGQARMAYLGGLLYFFGGNRASPFPPLPKLASSLPCTGLGLGLACCAACIRLSVVWQAPTRSTPTTSKPARGSTSPTLRRAPCQAAASCTAGWPLPTRGSSSPSGAPTVFIAHAPACLRVSELSA